MGVRASFGSTPTVVPGEAGRADLLVENTGGVIEGVRVGLVGQVAAWAWATPSTFTVAPGASQAVILTVRLPRATEPPPGPLAITVELAIAAAPGRPVTVHGTLDVAPFVDVALSIRPHTSQGRRAGRHQVTVENRGNSPVSASLVGEGEEVSVQVVPDRVEIGPGQQAEAAVTVRAGGARLRAGGATRAFEVVVRPDTPGAAAARASGVVEVPAAGWVGRAAVGLLVLALVGVVLRAAVGGGSGPGSTTEATQPAPAIAAALSDCPGRDHLSPDANGIVRPGVKPTFDYSFLFVGPDGCQPARFNPCAPVRYLLNRSQATDADVADLEEVMRRTSAATGLEFQFAGTSNEDPRGPARPVRAADGTFTWPPVLIGWAHLGDGSELRPRPSGGPSTTVAKGVVGGGGRPMVAGNVIATGNLVLNLDAVTDTDTHNPVPHGFGPGVNWGRIMMHELAHVIGLGHVESRTSIMNETLTQQTMSSAQWGVGDLIGLRYLGKDGGCLTVPALQTTGTPRP